jgi:hypothetical protein
MARAEPRSTITHFAFTRFLLYRGTMLWGGSGAVGDERGSHTDLAEPGGDRSARIIGLDRPSRYRLVEFRAGLHQSVEDFVAPDDDVALLRALAVAQGPLAELWRGNDLIRRWWVTAPGGD